MGVVNVTPNSCTRLIETPAQQQQQPVNQSSQVPAVTGITSESTRLIGAGVSKNALPIVR